MFYSKIFSLVLAAFTCVSAAAQTDCADRFDREGVYLRYEFWKGLVWVKNGESRPLGPAYRRFAPAFEKSPEAMGLFKKAQRNNRLSRALSIAAIVGVVGGTVLAFRQIDDQGYLIDAHKYRQGMSIAIGSATLGAAISMPFQFKSRRQLDDAVWLRNRDALRQ
jgi:hypothetical protein